MELFNSLKFERHHVSKSGKQAYIEFDNGYGVSVVSTPFSYGGKAGLYEVAVLRDRQFVDIPDWRDNVKGWLTERDVDDILTEIKSLS